MKQTERTYPQPCGCKYRFDDRMGLDGWTLERCAKHALPVRERMARVISGTGNSGEQRELAALVRGLKVQP
jgi:hypothetical protein